MTESCGFCGVRPDVACRHRPAVARAQQLSEPPADEPKKTDLRPFSLPGRAFAKHRADKRKEANGGK